MVSKNKEWLFILLTTLVLLSLILTCTKVKNEITRPSVQSLNGGQALTVVLDAGHGGEDGGAVGVNGLLEKDVNLSLTIKIGRRLERSGVRVIYTRTEDLLLYDRNSDYKSKKKAMDLAKRVEIAKNTPNCVFVSIHMNSFSKSQYKGLQVYYSQNDPSSKLLANDIQKAIKEDLQPENNRKTVASNGKIFILENIDCTAILIECGFLSNKDECELLSTKTYQNQLAEIISEKIKNYVEKYSQTY